MGKLMRFVFTSIIVTVWIFSGWPQIFGFPPKVQEAQAATVTVYATSNSTDGTLTGWTNPTYAYTDDGVQFATRVGTAKNQWYGTLYGFDLSSIPDGSVINSVTITAEWKNDAADTSGPVLYLGAQSGGAEVGTATSDTSGQTTFELVTNSPTGLTTANLKATGANGFWAILRFRRTDNTAHTASVDYVKVLVDYTPITAPTVSTQATTLKEATTATCNGTIDATGGTNATSRGCEWDIDTGAPYTYSASDAGSFGTGAFTKGLTSLPSGTTIYARAFATNSGGTGYGSEINFLTKPAAPTNVVATDGTATDKVTITWTKSTGATDYHVWRDTTDLGSAGDVATFDDTGAAAPTITTGSAVASDGTIGQIDLSLSGTSANNGTTHTYKVVASNATGNSADSATDTGYRGVGSLTYQWQRSTGDSDATYSDVIGATGSTYSDSSAPAPFITAGTASATDGSATDKVSLSVSGASANNGEGRYYKVVLNATGATQQISAANRGYRGIGSLSYQWYKSAGDSDSSFSIISGGNTASYDDTATPAGTITPGAASASDGTSLYQSVLSVSGQSANNGAGRYFYATLSATGASSADTSHDRGYRGVGTLTYQWQRSAGDSDASYSDIAGATTASYNDIDAPADGSGRYYKVVENATGATQQISSSDRGYKQIVSISLTTDGSVNFGYIAKNTTKDSTASGINDVETVRVDSGPADLDIKSTIFSQGANTWTLGTNNGDNIVKWEFSKDGTNWTTFASPDPTSYILDTNVSQSTTRSVYFRITAPTITNSYQQYGTTITIVASAP